MSELPPCPKFTRGDCPHSDPQLISDQDANATVWSLRCRTCHCCYVITKPTGRAAARFNNKMKRLADQQRAVRERSSRPRFYT